MLPFNFGAMCSVSSVHMFLIWTSGSPAVNQNPRLARTRSQIGQRPRAYILVRSYPHGNQKPGSGQQCPRRPLIKLGLHLSTTESTLNLSTREFWCIFIFKPEGGCFFCHGLSPVATKCNRHCFQVSPATRLKPQQRVSCTMGSIVSVFQILSMVFWHLWKTTILHPFHFFYGSLIFSFGFLLEFLILSFISFSW